MAQKRPDTENLPPLWMDRFRPKHLKKMNSINGQLARMLQQLTGADDFPHLLVYGPSGAGKKTLIFGVLRALYGTGVDHVRMENRDYETLSHKKFSLSALASNYHIDVCPSVAGTNRDKIVIQDLIKQTAQFRQIESATQQKQFKIVIIREADRLSSDAQNALRRTMEQYVATCKLVLLCTSSSGLMPAIRSRCLPIRVPAPTVEQISALVTSVAQRDGVRFSEDSARRVADASGRNMRVALMMAQAMSQRGSSIAEDISGNSAKPLEPDWRIYIRLLCQQMMQEQSPVALKHCRDQLYQLLAHCIAPSTIFRWLTADLQVRCDPSLAGALAELAAFYEHRCQLGRKPIYHLEAFVCAAMEKILQFNEEITAALGDDLMDLN